ncbi:MAG TPA: hypothetical protein VFH28_09080 [Nitrososphaera sp.]|nr:hypothetical protein [Nitrososphaera sp.]
MQRSSYRYLHLDCLRARNYTEHDSFRTFIRSSIAANIVAEGRRRYTTIYKITEEGGMQFPELYKKSSVRGIVVNLSLDQGITHI